MESDVQSVFVNDDAGVFRKLVTTIFKNNYIKCNNEIPIINNILIGNQEDPHDRPSTIARGLSWQRSLLIDLSEITPRRRSELLSGCQHTKRARCVRLLSKH